MDSCIARFMPLTISRYSCRTQLRNYMLFFLSLSRMRYNGIVSPRRRLNGSYDAVATIRASTVRALNNFELTIHLWRCLSSFRNVFYRGQTERDSLIEITGKLGINYSQNGNGPTVGYYNLCLRSQNWSRRSRPLAVSRFGNQLFSPSTPVRRRRYPKQ